MKIVFVMFVTCFLIIKAIDDLGMINDVVKSFEIPTTVIAKVCWKTTLKIKLYNILADVENPRIIHFVEELTTNHKNDEDIIVLVDGNCEDIRNVLIMANTTSKFGSPYRWLIFDNDLNNENAIPIELKDINILPNSEILIAKKRGANFTVQYVYKLKPHTKWIIEYYGSWSNLTGLMISKNMAVSTAMRRKNFEGERIVTSIVITDNKTDLCDTSDVLVDAVSKTGFRQTAPLYDFINATRGIITSDTWGYNLNGSWNGFIRHMIRGEAELAGTIILMTTERLEVLEFLSYPTPADIKFVFRQPPLSYTNNLFLLPFQTTVWYCIAMFILLLLVVLYTNALWESRKPENMDENIDNSNVLRPNLSDIAIVIVSAISQQGSSFKLRGTLGRVVILILFMVFLFLNTSYAASIVVLLQSTSNQIRTLSDLLNSKLELGSEDTPYNQYFMKTATDPVRKLIYETKLAPQGSKPNFFPLEDGIKKLQKEPFAFNMLLGAGYRLIEKHFYEHEKCGLQEIEFIRYKTYLTCRKNSPYKEIFKIGLFRIHEHGLNYRVNKLMYFKKPPCTTQGGSFGSVNMIDMYPSLIMLLIGMLLAFLILLIEILASRCQSKLQKKKP